MPEVTQLIFVRRKKDEMMEQLIERVNQRLFLKDEVKIIPISSTDGFGRSEFIGLLVQYQTHAPLKDKRDRELDNMMG